MLIQTTITRRGQRALGAHYREAMHSDKEGGAESLNGGTKLNAHPNSSMRPRRLLHPIFVGHSCQNQF